MQMLFVATAGEIAVNKKTIIIQLEGLQVKMLHPAPERKAGSVLFKDFEHAVTTLEIKEQESLA